MDVAKNAQHVVSNAKSGFLELGVEALKLVNSFRHGTEHRFGDALDFVGLQRKQSILIPIAALAIGVVVGGSVALLASPTTGKRLRRKIGRLLSDEIDQVQDVGKEVVDKVTDTLDDLAKPHARRANGRHKHA